ncbi:MAG: threonine/serine dehydratase [Gammaproteobacteria bacterium]|nr:threonine/serine dehydratase [Gammaproteobacteria bacterium]
MVEAAGRLSSYIRKTPLRYSAYFSEITGAEVYFKLENRQLTGSFKLRGALHRLLTLTDAQRASGCVAASSGNHGAAVACAMQTLGVSGVIFVPEKTSSAKLEAIRSYGGQIRFFGADGLDTELHARGYAADNDMFYVSPYNDEAVIAGQGTCGAEIADELPDIDAVLVAVGGGGLISGVGSVFKSCNDNVTVVGCQPVASPVMARSIAAGYIVEMESEPTLSDGTAGGIESDAITFAINQAVVDEFIEVSEEQIGAAMRLFRQQEGDTIEGAAGVSVAALLEKQGQWCGKRVAVIICGGNVADDILARINAGDR